MKSINSINFKDTEIGPIPETWNLLDFDEAVDFNPKRTIKKGQNTKFVEMANVQSFNKNVLAYAERIFSGGTKFKNGDTIMARITPCLENGKTAYINFLDQDEVAAGSTEFIVLSGKEGVTISDFVYYLAISPSIRSAAITAMTGTSGRQRVENDKLASYQLAVPSLEEQKQIAEILSSLDDKIELNRKISANLEKMASALFKKWFVDIGDELPEGWRMGKLGEEFEIIMGQSPSGDTYNELGQGIPFYQGRTDFGSRFPIRRVYCTDPQRKAMAFDTLISVRAPVGDVNMATEECCIGRGVGAIRKNGFSCYTFYMIKALQSEIAEFDSEGTIFGSINKNSLANISCVVPPKNIIVEFEKKATDIDSQILNLSKEMQNLTSIRDSLLPRLMSGKLRVLYGK